MAADVLVIGGGPAATWAAVAAAQAEARVILVDKGYVGTSGATAPANTGTWSPPPGERRQTAIAARMPRTGGLADPAWVERTLDMVWEKLHCLAEWGYPFPRDDNGEVYRANLRGPDYMHFMRRRVVRCRGQDLRPSSRPRTAGRRRWRSSERRASIGKAGSHGGYAPAPLCSRPVAAHSASGCWGPRR